MASDELAIERVGGRAAQDASTSDSRQRPLRPASYAAIDLGTNNCRLLVAEPVAARPGSQRFRVIDAFSRIVRLGEGLSQHGVLSQPAMDRAIRALSVCARKVSQHNVAGLQAVATEACRRAANCCLSPR